MPTCIQHSECLQGPGARFEVLLAVPWRAHGLVPTQTDSVCASRVTNTHVHLMIRTTASSSWLLCAQRVNASPHVCSCAKCGVQVVTVKQAATTEVHKNMVEAASALFRSVPADMWPRQKNICATAVRRATNMAETGPIADCATPLAALPAGSVASARTETQVTSRALCYLLLHAAGSPVWTCLLSSIASAC